jgi:hypothetical protein
MLRRLRARLTYANVTATLALFLALGGSAYAIVKLPKNSVGSKQIKAGGVKTPELAKAAVKGTKIATGAVDGSKIAAGAVDGAKIAAGAVDGSKIAAGAVGFSALSDSLRPVGFSYSRSIGSPVQETILDVRGYKLAASCENDGGLPKLRGFLTFPETGHVDVLSIIDANDKDASPGSGRVPVSGGVPLPDAVLLTASAGKLEAVGGLLTYTAPGRVALLTLHGVSNDVTKTCVLSGTLIPVR